MTRARNWHIPQIHPLLLAVYPALHLLAQNTGSVRPRAAALSLIVAAVAALGLWLISGAALRNRAKGALFTAATVVLFFAHGHVMDLVGGGTAAEGLLIGAGLVLLVLLAVFLALHRGDLPTWNRGLDVAGLVLVVLAVVPVLRAEWRPRDNTPDSRYTAPAALPLGYLPDIYVIVLDGLGRADQLAEIYGVDLGELQDHLVQKDFRIATRANANYNQTLLSLAALLNSDYLPQLLPGFGPGYNDKQALQSLVTYNRNFRKLREMGYRLCTLTGGSELAVQDQPDVTYTGGALNEFQSTLLATTPLPLLARLFGQDESGALNPFAQHGQTVRYQLGKLPNIQAGTEPKLVFAHILAPHPPFVITTDGGEVTPDYKFSLGERYAWDGYVAGYAGQATWVARELQDTVDGILAASRQPPVILILGDHGPASRWIAYWKKWDRFDTTDPEIVRERLAIFLALLMPAGPGGPDIPDPGVYPELTPVNVFPLIFARCFGETAVLQDDRSYFATYQEWSRFWNVDHLTGARRSP